MPSQTLRSDEAAAKLQNVEESAGRPEWRKEKSRLGPNLEERFDGVDSIFPGRLHIYNIDNEKTFTIDTKQGDSEVLLIEGGTVYYRVSDKLYAAPITEKGIGTARLLVKAEEIRDAHWAFIKH